MTPQALIPRRVASLWSRHVREDSLARLVWPLALASAAGVLLLAARVWHSGRGQHLYHVSDIDALLLYPRSNRPAIRFCAGFTGFLWVAYLLWLSFTRLDRDDQKPQT